MPEIAARAHVETIDGVVARALSDAGITVRELDGIAATAGPGLVGGVMVGLSFGKAMALALDLPLIAVNHLEGHAVSARLTADIPYPFLLLLVSGGHCQLLEVGGIGACVRLGSTIDDAAGEAFDKIGKRARSALSWRTGAGAAGRGRRCDPFSAAPRPAGPRGLRLFLLRPEDRRRAAGGGGDA